MDDINITFNGGKTIENTVNTFKILNIQLRHHQENYKITLTKKIYGGQLPLLSFILNLACV